MTARPRVMARLIWPDAAELTLAVALTASAGASFQRVFGLAPLLPVLGTAAVFPAAISVLCYAKRTWFPVWAAILVSLGCWLIVAGAALHGDLAALHSGLSDGWWQLLTTI